MPLLCIAGKNEVAIRGLDCARELVSTDHLCVVPTKADTGHDTWQPSLRGYASALGIRIVDLPALHDERDLVFLSLEFDRILRVSRFASSRLYNVHFSALPAYKGTLTSALALLHGGTDTGVTLHVIDAGIDTGPIVAQRLFPIPFEYTCRDLYGRFMAEASVLVAEWLPKLLAGPVPSTSQPAEGSTYFGRNSIDYAHLTIDLNTTGFQIYNQLRAFIFPDYQLPRIGGRCVVRACLTSDQAAPGTIIEANGSLRIAGIDGYVVEAFIA